MSEKIALRTEEDLIALLERTVKDGLEEIDYEFYIENIDPSLKTLTIIFEGEELQGVITTPMMEAVIAMQKQIYQLYADVLYAGNIRRLTADERKMLEVHVRIEDGSTIIEVLLGVILTELVEDGVEMGLLENTELLTFAAILLALNYGGRAIKWLTNKKAKDKVEELNKEKLELEKEKLRYADEESQRKYKLEHDRLEKDLQKMQLIAESTQKSAEQVEKVREIMTRKNIPTETMEERAENVLRPLMVAAEHADKVDIEGLIITEDEAEMIRKPVKEDKIKTQLNGQYRIQVVNTREIGVFKVQVRNVDNGNEFWAVVQENDMSGTKEVIQKAEWEKTPLHLSISAEIHKGKIVEAIIVSAEWLDLPSE